MLGAILGLGGAGGLASKVGQGGPMIGSADKAPIGNMLDTIGAGDVLGLNKKAAQPRFDNSSIIAAQEAMTGTGGKSAQEMEALNARARAAGFPDYQAMALFEQQKQRTRNNNSQVSGDEKSLWDNAMAWHPKNLLEYVNEKLRGATGQ